MADYPTKVWHASDCEIDLRGIRPGLHVGSLEQARMRRHKGPLYRLTLKSGCRTTRMKDTGLWSQSRIMAAARRAEIAIYLNRFEGVQVEDLDMAAKFAEASDALFARHVPSASTSWIVLDPAIIMSIEMEDA